MAGGGIGHRRRHAQVALTDAPACGYNKINVTVQKVRVNQSATAADGDAGWSVVLSPPQRIDLPRSSSARSAELGGALPVGNCKQMSLVLASNDASTPLANSVLPAVGPETALASPAGLQGGLKLAVSIDVVKDQVSDFVIDFDACNSVLRLGQPATGYNLSPRYSVVRRVSTTGMRVTGFVSTALDPQTTRISLQSDGAVPTVVRSTVQDSSGKFVLFPVPAGTYNLVISDPSRVVAVITNVPAADATSTDINTSAAPITPPLAGVIHTVTGTVNAGTPPIDARVAVIKKYTGGPNVVFAAAPADASTGALVYTVPASAAVRAPFAAGPLAFTNDTTSPPGRFTVAVTSGTTTKTADVDASGDPPAVSFTFPTGPAADARLWPRMCDAACGPGTRKVGSGPVTRAALTDGRQVQYCVSARRRQPVEIGVERDLEALVGMRWAAVISSIASRPTRAPAGERSMPGRCRRDTSRNS